MFADSCVSMKAHNLDVFAMAMAIMWVCGEELGNPLVAIGFAGWVRGVPGLVQTDRSVPKSITSGSGIGSFLPYTTPTWSSRVSARIWAQEAPKICCISHFCKKMLVQICTTALEWSSNRVGRLPCSCERILLSLVMVTLKISVCVDDVVGA